MFAYMEWGSSDKRFLEDLGISEKLYHRTFEDDIRKANSQYHKIVWENDIFRERSTGPEKIAVGREMIMPVLNEYRSHFTVQLLNKQIKEMCFIKGTDVYWVHACVECAQKFFEENLKDK